MWGHGQKKEPLNCSFLIRELQIYRAWVEIYPSLPIDKKTAESFLHYAEKIMELFIAEIYP